MQITKPKPLEGFFGLEMLYDLGWHCSFARDKNNINTKIMYNSIVNTFTIVSSEA